LFNPVPGFEFDGCIGEFEDFASLQRRWFNHNLVSRQIARHKHLSAKRATRSNSEIIHNCPMAHISPTTPIILGYQTYVTFHNTFMEDIVLDSNSSMPMTLYFAICEYLCPDIVFSSLPRQPPDGIFMAFIILVFIGFIFSAMTIRTCFKLSSYSLRNYLVAEIKAATWYTDRPIESSTTRNHTLLVDGNHFPWHDGFRSFISSIALIIYYLPRMMPTAIPRLCKAVVHWAHIFSVRARILICDTVFSHKFMI
jgi:hypothetical protein